MAIAAKFLKRARQQHIDLIKRLETKAMQLINEKEWDEQKIQKLAFLRYAFAKDGPIDQMLETYLSDEWGTVIFTSEQIETGYPFKADSWTDQNLIHAFSHDYLTGIGIAEVEEYLPNNWIDVPWYEFQGKSTPATGNLLLKLIAEYGLIDKVAEIEFTEDIYEEYGHTLVVTRYLTNQKLEQAKDSILIKAYKSFNEELKKALDLKEAEQNKISAINSLNLTNLKGKRICITGKLIIKRSRIKEFISKAGAINASSVSKTTDILIAGDESGIKLIKAQELGILIIYNKELMEIFKPFITKSDLSSQ